MRIVAGKYRGKKLFSPSGNEIRPTSDMARESVFNVLRNMLNLDEIRALDVFAGTGAFGLEAISRGALRVCFIDIDTALVSKNAKLFSNEQDKIKIVKADVMKLPVTDEAFDLIFLDAPYNKGLSEVAFKQLIEKNWIGKNALVVVETEKNEELDCFLTPHPAPLPQGEREEWKLIDSRTYGIAKFWFLKIITGDPEPKVGKAKQVQDDV